MIKERSARSQYSSNADHPLAFFAAVNLTMTPSPMGVGIGPADPVTAGPIL